MKKSKLSSNLKINREKKEKKFVEANKIVESIHEEDTKQMTVRMPASLHKKLKIKCTLDGIAINEFLVNLIEDGLLGDNRLDIV